MTSPRLAMLARLGPRGRALAALLSEHGRLGAALKLGVRPDDIDGILRVAEAMPDREEAPRTPRGHVPVRLLTKAERAGLSILVGDLVRAVGLRPLARRVGCAHRTLLLYSRGVMSRTASMLSPLSRVMGMRDASQLLLAAGAAGYEPSSRFVSRRRLADSEWEAVGLEAVDVEGDGPAGSLITVIARHGVSASEIATRLCVPVVEVHAAVMGATLPSEALETLAGWVIELTDPADRPPAPLKQIQRRGA